MARLTSRIAARVTGWINPEGSSGRSTRMARGAEPSAHTLAAAPKTKEPDKLFCAAAVGAVESVLWCLQNGYSVHDRDEDGNTPLHLAVYRGFDDVLDILVAHGASVHEKNDLGETPLFMGAWRDRRDIVRKLLELDARVREQNNLGETPLFYAAESGKLRIVDILLAYGASVRATNNSGETPLFKAAEFGREEIVRALLNYGALVNATSDLNETALFRAAKGGHVEVTCILIKCMALVNHSSQEGDTPLIQAGREGHMQVFRILIEAGASLQVRSWRDGETPLISAARWDYFPVVELLTSSCGDLADNDTSLSGSLETILGVCSSTYEFEPLMTHLAERLQYIHSQLQVQDGMASPTATMTAVLYRFCRFVFQTKSKQTPLDRFLGRRAITTKVRDFHDELDHFFELFHLDASGQHDWKIEWEARRAMQRKHFEKTVKSNDALIRGFHDAKTQYDDAVLLQYELQSGAGENSLDDSTLLRNVLDRYVQVNGVTVIPSVHNWFISPDDVEFHEWNKVKCEPFVRVYCGTWLKTTVTIGSITWWSREDFVQRASRWYHLSHPHVLKLLGACHLGQHPFFVYEYCSNRTTLREFLAAEENRHLAWKCLYKVALGLQYLHQRRCVHGAIQCSNIVIGPDYQPKIAGFGENKELAREYQASIEPKQKECAEQHISHASDIKAFGICILEALAEQAHRVDEIANGIRNGTRGTHSVLNDAQWDLVLKMCANNPSERVSISYVVDHLQYFAFEKDDGACETAEAEQSNTAAQCQLSPGVVWMIQKVYPALEFIYDHIIESGSQPTDVAVTRFCFLLARAQDYLRTAVSATSVARRARSQKAADVNRILYAELDRILDLLEVPSEDAIRSWKQDRDEAGMQMRESDDATSTECSVTRETITSSDTVALRHYDTHNVSSLTRSSDNIWDRSGRPVGDSPPIWHLALREIVFQVSDVIGEGGFGKVCRGVWLDTPVVVKFMGYEEDPGTVSTRLLLHEIRVWCQLNHPHVVKLFGANHIGKRYFVCEYASNGNLLAHLRKREDNREARWRSLYEVALGVQHMHSLNIVHNDLKCDNILVSDRGDAKIIDFGLSCIPDVAEIQVDPKKMGALQWKSPEYLKGEHPAIATDIYSLGMCILEVMTDDIPWGRNMIDAVVRFRVKQGFIPNRPEIMSNKQWNLVELMTKTNPSQRVKIAFVIDKLNEIVLDETRTASATSSLGIAPRTSLPL
ncbi:Serine/threonine protein kinase, partial [Globisporangium splendens]